MAQHPALMAGRAAVITGGASGIGLAAAKRFAAMVMKICLADVSREALDRAATSCPERLLSRCRPTSADRRMCSG